MPEEDAAPGGPYSSGREVYQLTEEQEHRIWSALPDASESERRRIVDEVLWAALQYIESAAGMAAWEEKPPPKAATVRNAVAAVENAGSRMLARLRDLDRVQRALGVGSLYSVHVLGGPPVACYRAQEEVEKLIAEAKTVRGRISRQRSGPIGNWAMRWFFDRLISVWERATGKKATRYRDSGAGVTDFIDSVVAIVGFVLTKEQIDYYLKEVLAERKARSAECGVVPTENED